MVKNKFRANEISEVKRRAKYTLEFKPEAVRLIKGRQAASVTATILGIPKARLENWVRLSARG
jgi:transposase